MVICVSFAKFAQLYTNKSVENKLCNTIKNSKYNQDISQTADNPMAPRGRAAQPS